MKRQPIIYIIILLVGLAGGMGIGFLRTKQKIHTTNIALEQLKTQQAQAESDLKTAGAKLSRLEAELTKSRNDSMRKNTELLRAQTELARTKKVLDQALGKGQKPAATPQTSTTTMTSRTGTRTTSTAGAREYTIKDGDSLWKIAADELGNGIRYEEILAMNPQITKNSTLAVGTKIKIPAN